MRPLRTYLEPLWLLLAVVLALGCGGEPGEVYEPPGGGQAKGCRQSVEFAEPMAAGVGLSSHLEWRDDEVSEARRAFEIARWDEIGARLIRRDLNWSILEPVQGEFDFTLADRTVDAAESVGGEATGLLVYGNAWACESSDDTTTPPDDPADFGNYAAAVAERYRSRIRRYEVWNEPNAGIRFWKPEEDPAAYGALLIEAADRVHEVDPDALVSFGGLFHPPLFMTTPGPVFLDEVFDAHPELADHIDAVAFHPYRYPFTAPEEGETHDSLVDSTCDLYEQLEARGGGDLELWITELGWHTAPDAFVTGVDEADQAAYLVRSTLLAFAQGVPVYQWYTFRDSGDDPEDQEQMFGLYGYDPDPTDGVDAEPKLAATGYATLTTQLGAHDRIEDLSVWLGLDDSTYAYLLSGGDGETVALWRVEGEASVRLPADGEATVTSMRGEWFEVSPEDGAVELTVGPEPAFVRVPGSRFGGR